MRILLMAQNYYPEVTGAAPFTTGLAEHFAEKGHAVSVATTFPHYPEWKIYEGYRGRVSQRERINGVTVRRTAFPLLRRDRPLNRVLCDSFLALGQAVYSATSTRPQVIITVTPPVQQMLVAAALSRFWAARNVMLIKDFPVDLALNLGMLRPGIATRTAKRLERFAYRSATEIVVISPGFRDKLATLGVPPQKIIINPDWADTEFVRPMEGTVQMRARLGANPGDFLLLHTGNMGEKQALESAVTAARIASERFPFHLALVGAGKHAAAIAALSNSVPNVRVLPLQPQTDVPPMLAAADALLLSQRADIEDTVAPSKLLTYLAAGRPVIAAVNPKSEAARLVWDGNCGIVVTPEDPLAIANAVERLRAERNLVIDFGKRGRTLVETHYSKAQVLSRWDELLESSAGARSANTAT